MPAWLNRAEFPLFVSHRRLQRQKTWKPAVVPWCLDSGGFTELSMYGEWRTTPTEYVTAIRRYTDQIGNINWVSPQDAMCEPWILEKAKGWLGGTVQAHQRWTVDNFLHLNTIAADINFIPVLQGWQRDDYLRHIDMYEAAGVDLRAYHTVGIGSVCRRQGTSEIEDVFRRLHREGLRMHGFGVKTKGLARYARYLVSADSMAWCMRGSKTSPCPVTGVKSCGNCYHFAVTWRDKIIRQLSIGDDVLQLDI